MNIRDLKEQDLEGYEMLKIANANGLFTLAQQEERAIQEQVQEQDVEVSPAEAEPTAEVVEETDLPEEDTVEQTAEETSQDDAEVGKAETEEDEQDISEDNYNDEEEDKQE